MLRRRIQLLEEAHSIAALCAFLCLLLPAHSLAASPPPIITVQPSSQTVRLNDSVTFTVAASSGTTMTYQWRTNGVNIPGATLNTFNITSAGMADQQAYSVQVINGGGTVISSNALLVVTNPPIRLSTSGSTSLTPAGFSFQLSVTVGSTYVILASTNNQDWTPIATNVAQTASEIFTDAAAVNYNMRFYRAMSP